MDNLRRVRDGVPWRLWIVAVIGFCERAAFWGLTAPWQNYMEHPPNYHDGQTPGALGLGQAKATRIYCCFYIFYYVTPIFVAILADSRLGQYTTLVASVVLYCLGIIALTISSIPANLAKGWGFPGLVLAMFLVGLGGGGVRAIFPPFIADQYTKTKLRMKTLKTGERVVIDYDLTLQYIYSLYFWVGNVGSLSWFATVFIEKRNGFTAAYGLTLGLMIVALLTLVSGKRWYVKTSEGSDLSVPQATRIILCVVKSGFKMQRALPDYQFDHRYKIVPWNSHMVEELTRGLRACRVLLAFVVFYVCFDQMQNNIISQTGQMNTHGTPNDLLPAMNQVGCIVLGPIIQFGLYPILQRRRIKLGPIIRIAIGFSFIALSMLYAALTQYMIYRAPPCNINPSNCSGLTFGKSGINVWLQAPVYFLISTGEIFGYVTGLEYAYDHSPKDMKVIVQAINLLMGGIGSAVALSLTTVAHDPNLVIFYGSLGAAMALTTAIFWLLFRKYDKIETLSEAIAPPRQTPVDLEKGNDFQTNHHLDNSRAYADEKTENTPTCSSTTLVVKSVRAQDPIAGLQSSSNSTLILTMTEDSSKDIEVHHLHQQTHLTTAGLVDTRARSSSS
ncbi:MFS general substrate transporter [Ophiobolus disseminans]|uniref:MFS general substrate transporter n=1 Tax=Ophiobolus disseminans TaxID=1469910 RepID=A0A6A6ZK98_9PLEO|nr:MFS general substrate transporter [Ophiobolus disseminans]